MSGSYANVMQHLEQSLPLVQHYAEFDVQKTQQELQKNAENSKLQVMLYGAYNAGKSTLVNALLGAEQAKVNDIPTTDKIDVYDWNGITLLDTPGVNAPIDHEETTEAQLKCIGAMLFVIREGDLDAKNLYERLFDITKRSKKAFIILNHQFSNEDDKIKAIQKINSNIVNLATQYGVTNQQMADIITVPINARTALTGRLKNHEKLIAHSGYSHFMQLFEQWITQQDEENQKFDIFKNQVDERWYQPILAKIKPQVIKTDSEEISNLRDDKRLHESEKIAAKTDIDNFIKQKVNEQKSQVLRVIETARSASDADNQIQQIFTPLGSEIEARIEQNFARVNQRLAALVGEVTLPTKHVSPDSNILLEQLTEQLKGALANPENLKKILLTGRGLKIPGLKGRWEKTLGAWAGRAAVVVQVATFFYDAHQANQAQEKQNQQQRQQTMQIHQATEQVCDSVISLFAESAKEAISEQFDEQIQLVNTKLKAISDQGSQLKTDYARLEELREQMLNFNYINA